MRRYISLLVTTLVAALVGLGAQQEQASSQPTSHASKADAHKVVFASDRVLVKSFSGWKAYCFGIILCAVLFMTAASVGGESWIKAADASGRKLADGFERYPTRTWAEGSTHSLWHVDITACGTSSVFGEGERL